MISWYTRYLRKCILFTIIPFEFFQWTGVGLNGQNGECATNRATQARRHACATATIQLQSSEVINVWGKESNIWIVTSIHVQVCFDLQSILKVSNCFFYFLSRNNRGFLFRYEPFLLSDLFDICLLKYINEHYISQFFKIRYNVKSKI